MITVENLVFDYPGLRALDGVSFAIAPGTITALVGPNGAGKTTLLRCIAALDTPNEGRVTVAGLDVHAEPRESHRRMGFLPDFFGLYDELTVARCLDYRAAAQLVPAAERPRLVERAAQRLGLADRMQQKAGTLSRGLRQRLAIAQAIIHEPKVTLLDEPAAGLDPEARHELSAVLRQLRDSGITLVVSSHILAELEDYSTDMLMLSRGRVIEHRPIGGPAAGGVRTVRLVLAAESDRLAAVLAAVEGIAGLRVDGRTAEFSLPDDPQRHHAVLRLLIAADLPVISFGPERADLQDAYLARVRPLARA